MNEKVAEIVADLEAIGLTLEQRVAVLAHMLDIALTVRSGPAERGSDETAAAAIEKRRAADRSRKALKRASAKKSAEVPRTRTADVGSADVRGHSAEVPRTKGISIGDKTTNSDALSADIPETTVPLLSLEKDSSKKDSSQKERKPSAANATFRGQTLAESWQPNPAHFEQAAALGFGREQVIGQAEDMRLWARAHGARKSDWDANFSAWMRRNARSQPGMGDQRSLPMLRPIPGGGNGRSGSIQDATARLIARAEARARGSGDGAA